MSADELAEADRKRAVELDVALALEKACNRCGRRAPPVERIDQVTTQALLNRREAISRELEKRRRARAGG